MNEKTDPKRSVVRHKRLELSLLAEPDPKSGASTNSANAARLHRNGLQNYCFFLNYARKYANFLSYFA